jgi:hypothetical protein
MNMPPCTKACTARLACRTAWKAATNHSTCATAWLQRAARFAAWPLGDPGELDLHGLNRDEARQQLATFLAECLHHGQRCVRVIHGKGHGSPQKLSILRQLVRGWLAQRQETLAYCQALPHDGGEGALIVLLRASKK